MKPQFVVLAGLAASSLLALAQPAPQLPAPWMVAGQSPHQYEAGVDADGRGSGAKGAKYLRHANGDGASWATLMQQFSAESYRGKRVRFSANVRTQDVTWSGLWMRVDLDNNASGPFYNSQDRPIKGTTSWARRSVVLDVPANAKVISIGVIGDGKGETWIDELKVEAVGENVPVDKFPNRPELPKAPTL
ncbi:transcriptional regulator [Pseudoduganella namucuonensis]|uniref:Transcriptional regulator n=1 Tax=Pseudoduganella namucuonensis TaxID=1035707 RepID=A0A1I7H906_9BURK|nr:transcriptional regulator [Pseudoduganella namucuonensis]SFU57185.1 hypothetical protein SAMN05216552_100574 [Pseudoduganella namucuonensis]